jgi:hypothetical protein
LFCNFILETRPKNEKNVNDFGNIIGAIFCCLWQHALKRIAKKTLFKTRISELKQYLFGQLLYPILLLLTI